MSAIIPSPAIKIAFKIFPIPRYRKITNKVKQIETIKPLFELTKRIENKKKKNAKRFKKNRKINIDEFGSVK